MGGDLANPSGADDSKGERSKHRARSQHLWRWIRRGMMVIGVTTGLLILGLKTWNFRNESQRANLQNKTIAVPIPEPIAETPKATPKETYFWSSQAKWSQGDQPIVEIKDLMARVKEILSAGESINSARFWEKVKLQIDGKDSGGFQRILKQIMAAPIDSYSTLDNSVGSDWSIVGLQQDTKSIAVLLRYFFEPIYAPATQSGTEDWIGHSKNALSFDEFDRSTQGLFSDQTSISNVDLNPAKDESSIEFPIPFFTPRFGYLILVIDPDSQGVICSDIISLPGEVRLSSIGVEGRPKIQDVFGEYQASTERSIARTLFFGQEEDPENKNVNLGKFMKSVKPDRAQRLAEIAESSMQNSILLAPRMTRFRKDFPDDFGGDVLLVSLWFTHHQGKKRMPPFDDFGRFFVEAAHRLFLRTNDPILLEVKSRIYFANGKLFDAEKSLEDAEMSNFKSLYMLRKRIEEASKAKNKGQLTLHLSQMKDLVLQKPSTISNQALRSKWNQQRFDWQGESKPQQNQSSRP
jgi:hypothetical protein